MIPLNDEGTSSPASYLEHVTEAASFEDFQRHKGDKHPKAEPLLSAEALPENASLIDFKAFARDYPEKLAPLVARLRPEFQEYFAEYYLLEKSQSFIGKTHGCIQTRVWQNLRIIERSIGSMILLGPDPGPDVLRPILVKAGVENTYFGSLTDMIVYYAVSHNYAVVAEKFHAPIPTIRKIFRPMIKRLLVDKNVKAVAIGAYLHGLTHLASLRGPGLGKRYLARLDRVRTFKFVAPPSKNSPIMEFGKTGTLHDTPWCMLEISAESRMAQLYPLIQTRGNKLFRKNPAQIFAPVDDKGELVFGYIFARCNRPALIRLLLRIKGISELSALRDGEGNIIRPVTVPHEDVRAMMKQFETPEVPVVRAQDFVEILTGQAARYCGTVVKMSTITEALTVEILFPTGKRFLVKADPSCVKVLPNIPKANRRFWGTRLS